MDTVTMKIERKIYKILQQIKLDNELTSMSKVIDKLIKDGSK